MKLKTSQKAAYGFGAFGKDVVYMLVATYLLNYYNVVLGMDSVFVGTVMMIARIFDAFNDPFMGIIVAKTKTKWGKLRPWIFCGTVLNALTIYALFATPNSSDPNSSMMKTWLIVFYFAWGITYTLMDIPFWSMIPAITEPGEDREQISSIARTCAGVGAGFATVLTQLVVPILGAGSAIANIKIGYKWWAIIIAVVFVVSETLCVSKVPEKPVEQKPSKIFDMFRSLFSNDQALTVVGSIILVYTSLQICGNLVLYFFQFDVGNSSVGYTVFTGVSFVAQIIAMMIIPLLRKKYSKSQLFITGFIIQIIGFAVILVMSMLNAYSDGRWFILCLPGMLIYAGYGILNVIMTIFLSDSIDYGELKNGSRDEAVIFSMQTFTVKLASGIAVFLAGFIIRWVNLNVTEGATNSIETLQGLRLWMTIPSIILLILGIILYKSFYKLDEQKMDEIKKKLRG